MYWFAKFTTRTTWKGPLTNDRYFYVNIRNSYTDSDKYESKNLNIYVNKHNEYCDPFDKNDIYTRFEYYEGKIYYYFDSETIQVDSLEGDKFMYYNKYYDNIKKGYGKIINRNLYQSTYQVIYFYNNFNRIDPMGNLHLYDRNGDLLQFICFDKAGKKEGIYFYKINTSYLLLALFSDNNIVCGPFLVKFNKDDLKFNKLTPLRLDNCDIKKMRFINELPDLYSFIDSSYDLGNLPELVIKYRLDMARQILQ